MPDVKFNGRRYSIAYHDVTRGIKDARAIALYYVLLSYTTAGDSEAHPSLPVLAEAIGLSPKSLRQVRDAIARLESLGLVRVFARYRNDAGEIRLERDDEFNVQTSNGYEVFDRINGANEGEGGAQNVPGGSYSATGVVANQLPGAVANQPYEEIPNKEIPIEELISPPTPSSVSVSEVKTSEGDPQADAPTQTKPSKRQLDEEFDRFWGLVGRKRGKQQARKSFEKQRRAHSLEFICSQITKAQAEWVNTGRDPGYWPHPSTWLNQQLEDDYDTTRMPSQREFYEARVKMLREQHLREKGQLRSISQGSPVLAIPASCVEDDDQDEDDDDWDWSA